MVGARRSRPPVVQFKRGDVVRAVLRIYQGTGRTDALAPVVIRVRVLDAKGTALRDQSLPFPESSFANRRTDCVITLPLSTLAPGEYLLKLDASANRNTSGRALRFRVDAMNPGQLTLSNCLRRE